MQIFFDGDRSSNSSCSSVCTSDDDADVSVAAEDDANIGHDVSVEYDDAANVRPDVNFEDDGAFSRHLNFTLVSL